MSTKPTAQFIVRSIVLAALIAATISCERNTVVDELLVETARPIPDSERVPRLDDLQIDRLAKTIVNLLHDEPAHELRLADPASDSAAVYVALRASGKRLADSWAKEMTLSESLAAAVKTSRKQLSEDMTLDVDTVELVLAHNFRPFKPDRNDQTLSNRNRGVTGLELSFRDRKYMLSPTRMIAENRSFLYYINTLNEVWGLPDEEISQAARFRSFQAEQFLISITPTVRIDRMFRGNQFVAPDAVDRASVAAMAERLGDWLVQNVHIDGRMTYLYRPGTGEDRTRNNMLRQWMATVSLMQIAQQRQDVELTEIAAKNLRYNLDKFYRVESEFGFIEFNNKAKLGAMAIATLAIMNAPNRHEFAVEQDAMTRTMDYLWNEDGSFRTFYKPAGRNDVQNFYPGETLLVWALMYRESPDASRLEKIMRSFEYYRDWHRNDRNPAFVPWHTQAYYLIWQETRNDELAEWVFEMNDWLLGVQQKLGWSYPDTEGRFYDPVQPFGPPHVSSTAVYLEGLIDAFAMARELGHKQRAERYRASIVKGLRSLMQVEFSDHIDMYYVSDKNRVRGGMRTTVYDNQVRVDNVQHSLMAVRKILETFSESDFSLQ